MQIHLPMKTGEQRQVPIQSEDAAVIEGRSGVAVRVGETIVGVASEDVASVSLRVLDGQLRIQLHDENGRAVHEHQVPGPEALQRQIKALREAGVVFSVGEREALADLMRLTMSAGVSQSEVVMVLDEITHLAAKVEAPPAVAADDLYPELERQIQKLLKAMPDEIQRFVILSNREAFSDDHWRAFTFISKVDAKRDPLVAKFLAGEIPMNDKVMAAIKQIAQRADLAQPGALKTVDAQAFNTLVKALQGLPITSDGPLMHFPEGLSKHIFDSFQLQIPDFAAAPSFEELEQKFMAEWRTQAEPKRDPLAERLMHKLERAPFRELWDFLSGKPGAPFSLAVKEGLVQFLKQAEQAPTPQQPLRSLDPAAFARVREFLEQSPHAYLLKDLPQTSEAPKPVGSMVQAAERLAELAPPERLALFTMDRVDAVRNPRLFSYLDGEAGLARMTPDIRQALNDFLGQTRFPMVARGLEQFQPPRFRELSSHFAQHHPDLDPPGFFPNNSVLQEALLDLGQVEEPPLKALREVAPQAPNAFRAFVDEALANTPPADRNQALTRLLVRHLGKFERVAMLDQIWRGEGLLRELLNSPDRVHEKALALTKTLRGVLDVLSQKAEPNLDWDLWRAEPPERSSREPGEALRRRVLREAEGMGRYRLLDQLLDARQAGLAEKVSGFGWVKKVARMLRQIEAHRNDNHPKLIEALRRFQPLMGELADSVMAGEPHEWAVHGRSPLAKKKLRQFAEFREAVLRGDPGSADTLFQPPFLRSELGERAEQLHQQEMKKFEPLFRDMVQRFQNEGGERIAQMMRVLQDPGPDVTQRLQGLLESLRDFNQYQNLNQEPLYLSLPFKHGQHQSDMELAYFRVPSQSRDRQRFLVVIHLDFDHYGHLRVDALREEDALNATFWVSTRRMHHQLVGELHLLEDRLEEAGLGDTTLRVKVEPQRAASSVAALCVAAHDGQLDVSI